MPFRLDRAFLRVAGPDSVIFLENLLTQSVPKLVDSGALNAALLNPQGKVVTDMTLWSVALSGDEDAILIELDPARADHTLQRLRMFKLRSNVEIDNVSAEWTSLFSSSELGEGVRDPRHRDLGWRDIARAPVHWTDGSADYEKCRLTLGVPDLARDAQPEEVFAGEALLDELNGVDFQKGCFVGQENVSRMKRRATTRKKFCPVVFYGPAPAYGAKVTAGAAELGQIRTGMEGRAIALLRLDRALAAQQDGVKIEAEGRQMRLDPPSWLILPPREGAPSGTPD